MHFGLKMGACWSLSCQLLAACYLKQMKITLRKIESVMKPSVGQVDCRPELQTTDLSHGDGRKRSAGMSGSKKKHIFPHVMDWPSLHIHGHRASVTTRVIRVLTLPSCCSPRGDKSLWGKVEFANSLQVDKGSLRDPSMWVWVALLPIAGSAGCLDYRWWRFVVGVVLSCWENFRSRYLSWSAM